MTPVVEDVVRTFEVRLGYRKRFERRSDAPLVLMTQRRRLDAFLVEQAAAAGAVFRDGVTVEGLTVGPDGATLASAASRCTATSSSARTASTDGSPATPASAAASSTGSRSRATGRCSQGRAGARRSSSASCPAATAGSSRRRATPTTASAAGRPEGPRLREHLQRLCAEHGVDAARSPTCRAGGCRSGGRRAPPAARCCSSATPPGSSTRSRATGSTRRSSRRGSRRRRSSRGDTSRYEDEPRRRARPLRRHLLEGEARARPPPAGRLRDRADPGGLARDRRPAHRATSPIRATPAAWPGRRCGCWRGSKAAAPNLPIPHLDALWT